jgi:riboflavin kinase / FMN adenylyltransferase
MKIICDPKDYAIGPCVATIGFFDGVHKGHRYLIEQVKAVALSKGLCTALITFPVHPRKVINANNRLELLSTLREKEDLLSQTGVDYCFLLNFTAEISALSAHDFMSQVLKKQFHVDTLIIGYDHRFGHNRSEGFNDYYQYGKGIGMEVMHAKALTIEGRKISSSVIRTALLSADLDLANYYLGYNYYLDGIVVTGHKVGRTIGFPTANMSVDPDKIIPADGVYAVRVSVEGTDYIGMINIGHRPTLNNGVNRTLEVNILHFSDDIYGKTIRVSFVKRIRSEVKFNGIEALKAQLHDDQMKVEEIFKDKTDLI